MTFDQNYGPVQQSADGTGSTANTLSNGNAVRQYLVLKRRGKWCFKSRGRFSAPYASETKATQAAIDRAEESGKKGKPAMVVLFAKPSELKTIWISGRNPYPTMWPL
jgi:hypothetical protein